MPTYEYRCPEGHEFERFYRKISDAAAEVACPECGKIAARRLSAGAGLLFKGSGFYLTDYGKNAHRKSDGPSKSSGESGSSESGSSESKSDAKPSESKSKAGGAASGGGSAPSATPAPKPGGSSSDK